MQNDPILHPRKSSSLFYISHPVLFLEEMRLFIEVKCLLGLQVSNECPVCEVDKLDILGLLHGNGIQVAEQDTEPLGLTFIIHPLFQLLRIHKWVNPLMKSEHA